MSTIEYALITAFVAIACFMSLSGVGAGIKGLGQAHASTLCDRTVWVCGQSVHMNPAYCLDHNINPCP